MPRKTLRPDEVAAFRRRAVEAATRLFAERGYGGVTMRGLGEVLGVSAMTPYRYLESKDELFALVRAEAFRRFAERLEAALARGGGDALARLRRLKQAYVAFAIDEPDAYRIMFELRAPVARDAPGTPGAAELAAQARRAFGCLHRTVAEAIAAGQIGGRGPGGSRVARSADVPAAAAGDPLTVAHLMWASTHGLVSLHLAGQLAMGRSLRALASIDHELAGFAPSPPPRSPQAPRRRTGR